VDWQTWLSELCNPQSGAGDRLIENIATVVTRVGQQMVDNAADFAAGLAMQQEKEDPQQSLVKAFRLIWIERRVQQGEELVCNSLQGTQPKEAGTGDGVLKLRASMLRAEVRGERGRDVMPCTGRSAAMFASAQSPRERTPLRDMTY
jgi:hypothetical protein